MSVESDALAQEGIKSLNNEYKQWGQNTVDNFNKELKQIGEAFEDVYWLGTPSITSFVLEGKQDSWNQLKILAKNAKGTRLPTAFVQLLIYSDRLKCFIEDFDGKFFAHEFKEDNRLSKLTVDEEKLGFFKFATTLGCFSKEKVLDRHGKETGAAVGQNASILLRQVLDKGALKVGEFHGLFDSLSLSVEPNQDFIKFISVQNYPSFKYGKTERQEGEVKEFLNISMLKDLDRIYPGIFTKTMADFNKAQGYRTTISEDGVPVTVSWEDALKKFYLENKYTGVTLKNSDLAKLFSGKGMEEEAFKEADALREQAEANNIPRHILGKPLTEKTIFDSIKEIKDSTDQELLNSKELIDDLYSKMFSYEWLDKRSPYNPIIGLYAGCCATITSQFYGKNIVGATIKAKDVQNLVVRDRNGEIIAKGAVYVSDKLGYAVLNDFEMNQKYRDNEKINESIEDRGRYDVKLDSIAEQERDMIFAAFQRGIKAFVDEYDLQHPDNPIKQVNIGMRFNRLKRQVEQFEKATELLKVPAEYSFNDALEAQHVLYRRSAPKKTETRKM